MSLLSFCVAGCGVEGHGDDAPPVASNYDHFVIEGDLPAGVELDELSGQVPSGGFGVVVDPATGRAATVYDAASPLARDAAADFSVSVSAVCTDCVGCGGAMTRTIDLSLMQDGGADGTAYSIAATSSFNYVGFATTPSSFSGLVGQEVDLSTTGTVPACAPFGHFFTVEAPDVPSVKRAFVSSVTSNPDLGGLAGADLRCNQLAANAGLGGTWVAWLSTSTVDARDRLSSDGPWETTTGLRIADDKADLLDGSLQNDIVFDEFGNVHPYSGYSIGTFVWTGTLADGTWSGVGTSDWTDPNDYVLYGFTFPGGYKVNSTGWTEVNLVGSCQTCTNVSIYCFEP